MLSSSYAFCIVLLMSFMSTAINPGCKCVRFTTTFGKEWGVFSSPDYPHDYPVGIRCLLYSFQAPKGSLVHVLFDSLHLPQSAANGCRDYLKTFLHLNEEGVNEKTPWNTLVCGQSYNQSFYSASRHLIIQFHSAPHRPAGTAPSQSSQFGFVGRFRFLNSSQYESNGRLVPGTKCDYQFLSSNASTAQGLFFSPHHPSTYPHNIMCAYHFHAGLHERIRVVFETVALQPGQFSCLNKTDVIRILDGSSSKAPVISLICNSVKDLEILSSGPHLQIEFIANSDSPGNGFRAKFHFTKVQLDSQFDAVRLNSHTHQHLPSPDMLSNGQDGLPQASTLVPQCNQVITSDAGRNGTFSSPNYPNYYSAKTFCRYDFIGHGKERVQIVFTDFNLFQPEAIYIDKTAGEKLNGQREKGRGGRCSSGGGILDVLSTYVYVDGELEKIVDYCGSDWIPPQLMSNGHRIALVFNASTSSPYVRGFAANYAFVEDFGISTGQQLPEYPCAFVYNSSEASNGSFSSPNWPGLYPRETECHYFFHGNDSEHVEIHFTHFHVHGFHPCTEATGSDYLEFSNYMPVDTKFQRKCGQDSNNFRVISERKFFRVTFRSNDRYDATGFFALFHFTDKINQITVSNVGEETEAETHSPSSAAASPKHILQTTIQVSYQFCGVLAAIVLLLINFLAHPPNSHTRFNFGGNDILLDE